MMPNMSAKKHDSAVASPRRRSTQRGASSKKISALDHPGENDTTGSKTRRHRRVASSNPFVQSPPGEPVPAGEVRLIDYYLTRQGIVLGPYTAFQMLESVRLGIFEDHDLAWTEESGEWLEVSRLLPVDKPRQIQPPPPLSVACRKVEDDEEWLQASPLPLTSTDATQEPLKSGKRLFMPLTEQQLREHEMLFAQSPLNTFIEKFVRWSFAETFSDLRVRTMAGWRRWYTAALQKCRATKAVSPVRVERIPEEACC